MQETNNTPLSANSCTACSVGTPPLQQDEIAKLRQQLNPEWQVVSDQHLYRQYRFKNFHDAMQFANQIAAIAEAEKHHPDLAVSWGRCEVKIWTHKINGLSYNDFILAAKIDALLGNK